MSAADVSQQGECLATCTGLLRLLGPAPTNWWLKTTAVYFLTTLEAERLKSRCWQVHAPSQGAGDRSCLSLPAPVHHGTSRLAPAHANFCLCCHVVLSVCLRVSSPLLIRTPGTGFRAHHNPELDYICKDSSSK